MNAAAAVENLYPALIAGDVGAVLGAFGMKATVDSPLGGKQQPPEWVAESRAWLEEHAARSSAVNTVATPERVAHECSLDVWFGGAKSELAVMLVADILDDEIRDLRVYHSTWPITGSHSVRAPLMDYDLVERPAEPVGAYHDALAAGDAEAVDRLFEPDGYVREPAGSAYSHVGAGRTAWYQAILGDGPLRLRLGTITDDGTTVVYEYMVESWGSARLPRQAGAAAYTRAPSGQLASARIYDDVDPPPAVAGS
ncbi:MAG: nuclear transport factor 2 family protein [Coriobacteriia bacterium]|nr:nuclear transport factor 2 family protein [Coriobacteriia bacterium]